MKDAVKAVTTEYCRLISLICDSFQSQNAMYKKLTIAIVKHRGRKQLHQNIVKSFSNMVQLLCTNFFYIMTVSPTLDLLLP